MARPLRYAPGGMVFHVFNRGVGRRTLFEKDADYLAFEKVIQETLRTRAHVVLRLLSHAVWRCRMGRQNGESLGAGVYVAAARETKTRGVGIPAEPGRAAAHISHVRQFWWLSPFLQ